ncbi:hypothetical protein DDB_G0292590 [Dictyostelium discoideum AX4]|uniref:FNIP repeat-containing protein n=1 Tax=Dictyostelium discoideum TaxID=44689 RepID=Q54D09_DICDI|nr:hypothetical protein DDB_G0292590 [Dictyostelium discoideum AX4]EAL61098.1 hypothetical protein DDB_G0292590 [Dictyostelium discoideum AX4]|eukprot:XP_629511.1 hypothetical protein DDB_G0292590 [Dictyostelium discoideum AX4]
MDNNNNNDNNNDKLFFKIWRNKFILKNIIYNLKRIIECEKFTKYKEFTIKSLIDFNERDIIRNVYLGIDKDNENECFTNNNNNNNNENNYYYLEILDKGVIPYGVVELSINNNKELINGSIPSTVETLNLMSKFKQEIKVGILPSSISKLKFSEYNIKISKPSILPINLKSIDFGLYYNQEIEKNILPNSLEILKLSNDFNKPLDFNNLPINLKHLIFGDKFNKELLSNNNDNDTNEKLPNLIEFIKFGESFDQEFNILNLKKLKIIIFGSRFNSSIFGLKMCESLETVEFGSSFNQIIDNQLPNSLKNLKFGLKFDKVLLPMLSLPKNLETLEFGLLYNQKFQPNTFPLSLTSLKFGFNYNQTFPKDVLSLNSNLKILHFGYCWNQPFSSSSSSSSSLNILPFESITELKFGKQFYQKIKSNLFRSAVNLKSLDLGDSISQSIAIESLPKSLSSLTIGNTFNEKIESLPVLLKCLQIGSSFNSHSFPINFFPNSLERLSFNKVSLFNNVFKPGCFSIDFSNLVQLDLGQSFNQTLKPNTLPNSLKILNLSTNFNKSLEIGTLPQNLQELTFGLKFNQPILKNHLPLNLKKLIFPNQSKFNQPLTYFKNNQNDNQNNQNNNNNNEENEEKVEKIEENEEENYENILPNGLIELKIGGGLIQNFKYSFKDLDNLETLKFSYVFDKVNFQDIYYNENLKHLEFWCLGQDFILPPNLVTLTVAYNNSSIFDKFKTLPKSLKLIKLFNTKIEKNLIPPTCNLVKFLR